MSIFGLSLIDNFGFDFINNFLIEFKIIISNTIDYLTNTKFYNYLSKLFLNEIETPSNEKTNQNGSLIKENSRQTIRNEEEIRENKGNSKISE
jgi:hypothetical protein